MTWFVGRGIVVRFAGRAQLRVRDGGVQVSDQVQVFRRLIDHRIGDGLGVLVESIEGKRVGRGGPDSFEAVYGVEGVSSDC